MIMNVVMIIFTIFSCVQSQNYNDDNWPTQVVYKSDAIDKTINSACDSSFLQFIQKSTIWIDKSVLITKIWGINSRINYDVYIISAATRWGKTTNSKMMKFYHQLEVDEHGNAIDATQTAAYKYFVEGIVVMPPGAQPERINVSPMISKYPNFNNEHLAAHSVITLDGSDLDMRDPESIRGMISKAFQEHQYLERKWKQNADRYAYQLETFHKYLSNNRSIPLAEFIYGIEDLSYLLYTTYKRYVIILYDEHDAYLHRAYFRDNGSPFEESAQSILFLESLQRFMLTTFKRNSHLTKGFITGVFGVHDATLNNVHNGYVFTDPYLFPFYGIFQREFISAMKVANLNDEVIKNATKWYDGYRILTHLDEPMFSMYSISNCLTRQDVQNNWTDSAISNFIPKLLNQPQFREDIMQLIKEESTGITISRNDLNNIKIEDLALIQRLYMGLEPYGIREKHRYLVFSILISFGFITYHHVDNNIEIRLPNWEMWTYMNTKWLDSMKINQDKYKECCAIIRSFVFGDDENILDKLAKCVSSVLLEEGGGTLRGILVDHNNGGPKEPLDKMITSNCLINEATLESLLYVMIRDTLKFDYTKLDELKSVQQADKSPPFMNRRKTDMLFIIKNKMALVFENKFHRLGSTNPKPVLTDTHSQAISYSAFFIPYNISDIPVFKFIALHAEHSGKVEVRCASLSYEQLESAMAVSKSKLITEISSSSSIAKEEKSTKIEKMNYDIWNDSMWKYIEAIKPSVTSFASYDPAKTS